MMTGVDIVHIPYKGGAPALVDLLRGTAQLSFNTTGVTPAIVRAGKLTALAACTTKRISSLPDIPTIAESGVPGYDVSSWTAVVLPAGTPKEIISKLHSEIVQVLKKPDVAKIFNGMGMEIVGNTPEEFSNIIKPEIQKWAKVIKQSGDKLD